MKKKQFTEFCRNLGWTCHFSGRTNATYVNTRDNSITLRDIEVVTAQHFGVLPDFKLFKA